MGIESHLDGGSNFGRLPFDYAQGQRRESARPRTAASPVEDRERSRSVEARMNPEVVYARFYIACALLFLGGVFVGFGMGLLVGHLK